MHQGSFSTPSDDEYLRHTSLKKYMPYMLGGGYVLSSDLAEVILGINRQSKDQNLLKLMASEDVTIGFWLMSVELRRVDHPKMDTGSGACCFAPVDRVPGTLQGARCVTWKVVGVYRAPCDVCLSTVFAFGIACLLYLPAVFAFGIACLLYLLMHIYPTCSLPLHSSPFF